MVIPARFNGPPNSGQGGYSCGVAGRLVPGAAAEVRLLAPPPLDTPFDVDRSPDGSVRFSHAGTVVAEGRPVELDLEVPSPVSYEEATHFARAPEQIIGHPFPTCFGCGPDRAATDGLRLFPGYIAGRQDEVACPLSFDRSLADSDGVVPAEVVWAALDCPSGWAFHGGDLGRLLSEVGMFVTGTIAAAIEEPVRAGERYVVQGWTIGREGRKLFSGAAIFTEAGAPVARCRQAWILLK